jgi:hypothetical protein
MAAGCSLIETQKSRTGTASAAGQMTKEELRTRLDGFAAFFKSTLTTAAEEIVQKSNSKKDQMLALQMQTRMLQGLYLVSQEDDPVVAFIDTWALSMRFQIYLVEGDGAGMFGVHQPVAIDAAKRIEASIEDIGRLFLTNSDFQTTQKNIVEFTRANPIKVNFTNVVVYATQISADQQNPFLKIVSLPMAPFRGIEGVERTASAISRFTDTADRFSDVVADLPESSRWQMLMFLYELEETEMSKSLVSSTTRLADSTEQLPQRIREQLSIFMEEIDQKQANLQATLVQADETAAAVVAVLERVKAGADSIDAAAKSVQGTAIAWQDAAGATGDAIREAGKLIPEQKSNEPGISAKDIQTLASQVTQTAGEIRATAADLKAISGTLTWRIIEIIFAILAAVIIYRIVMKKLKTDASKN